MTHRILVLGAGYAGTTAAGALARRLRPADAEITLINASPHFVERVRMHELAVGRSLRERRLEEIFARTGVQLVTGRVTTLDADAKQAVLADGRALAYDSMILGLGSASAPPAAEVTGNPVHTLGTEGEALRMRTRLAALPPGGRVVVVGAGLTGLEAVTEIAESRPDLDLTLLTSGAVGEDLSARGSRHVCAVFARLGILVHDGVRVESVDEETVRTDDGRAHPADLVVWCGGYRPSPLPATSALETHADGRVLVDRALRSYSHPDVLAVGDTAWTHGPGGRPLRMACASGIPMGWQAAETLVAQLHGRSAPSHPRGYVFQCLSLGCRDGLIQPVRPDDTARGTAVGGRPAAIVKERVCAAAAWVTTRPTLDLPVPARAVTT